MMYTYRGKARELLIEKYGLEVGCRIPHEDQRWFDALKEVGWSTEKSWGDYIPAQ